MVASVASFRHNPAQFAQFRGLLMAASPERADASPFASALPVIKEATAFVCRRHRCSADEAEEFGSFVHVKMLEKDCAVLRQYTGAASLRGYLGVVLRRLFIDFRRERWGVWRPSTEARRTGGPAIRLDTLIHRDRVPLEEAIEQLRANEGVALSVQQLREIADRLPRRHPRRSAAGDTAPEPAVSAELAVERVALADVQARRAGALRAALREALSRCPDEDAVILRLHFVNGLTIARVAAMLGLEQKPLYRRVERLLRELKGQLERAGFAAGEVAELVGDPAFEQEEDSARSSDVPA